ncbi:long-chain fatty acid--CoA ligase [Flammeovirgaceae bacterium SG7u.111]|nr:long-chain fatty acid--CoA ligase [Flammeovirgaceae bacterium SG7u.132]WPO33935.1 long-chain fatty acid--CoA ligase [Flammeovirgaceae bacterium SG7u.111]
MNIRRTFDFLHYQLEKFPQQKAISSKVNGEWKSFSTQEVADIVNQLSVGLMNIGIFKGDKIAVISENRPEWNFVDLAAQQLGVILVPLYATLPPKDCAYILEHAECKLVFASDQELYNKIVTSVDEENALLLYSFEKLEGVQHWTSLLKEVGSPEMDRLKAIQDSIGEEELMTIIYTSGTTGKPKGVMLSHKNVVTNVKGVYKVSGLVRGKFKVLSFLPLSHIYERSGFLLFLFAGSSIYYAESLEKIGDNLREVKPHFFNSVPRLLEKVMDKIIAKANELSPLKKSLFNWAMRLGLEYEPHKKYEMSYRVQMFIADKLIFSKWREALGGNISSISCGGAALQPRLGRVFWAAGIKVCEGYGMTECAPVIAANYADNVEMVRMGATGMLVEGVEVKIAKDGEVLCKGPNIMMGYYKEPALTAEVLKEGWFHTGDIGEVSQEGFLKITDRKKEIFKTSGGKYIAPQVLENKLKESLFIEQVMVVGENRKFPSALIVPNFDGLKDWCVENKITFSDLEELVKQPGVINRIANEVSRANELFGNWERVKQFRLIPQIWSIETGELTPKMSMKRRVILEKFSREIEDMYV